MEPPVSLQVHRTTHNSSKLPSYRIVDIALKSTNDDNARGLHHQSVPGSPPSKVSDLITNTYTRPHTNTHTRTTPGANTGIKKDHIRNHSEIITKSPSSSSPPYSLRERPVTSPAAGSFPIDSTSPDINSSQLPLASRPKTTRNLPASHSNAGYLGKGPPPAMLTQRTPFQAIENPTKDWVVNQSSLTAPTTQNQSQSSSSSPIEEKNLPAEPSDPANNKPITPLIPPIRGFRTSRKSSVDNAIVSPRSMMDQDETLTLDGYTRQRSSRREQEEQSSDDSDLFLKMAREETAGNIRGPIRRSQINRQSLPPSHTVFQPSNSRRRGSDLESSSGEQSREEQMSQALTYRPSARERVPTALDMSRNRYFGGTSHSTPTTPRALNSREISPESQVSYGGRRPSVPDHNLPSRTGSYRQSNLSYSTPRTYNSSPLVSRTTDNYDTPEQHRTAEGTESTVSTTAPSTVWDELEDLKSRIHRLELTGKLPATSGAAMSRVSNDRPPTATTTVTTMSSSPKRGQGNSVSPIDSNTIEPSSNEAHPLLNSALAKSKTLLSPDVFNALEATAADALSIASMMGSSGQPGPISSSQSTIGGGANIVSDRQVRRKTDSLCRSLTELCLALSEGKSDQVQSKPHSRPGSRDAESTNPQQALVSTDLARVKASPRALSRLEARRSSLLNTSSLPSPRYTPSEIGTPTQSSMAGRRTSLLLRSRRAATEERDAEEEDESRFRAPSRAATEIGRMRPSPRDHASSSQQSYHPLQLDNRSPSVQSSLPIRRHYASSSLTHTSHTNPNSTSNTNSNPNPNSSPSTLPSLISNIADRRYLNRSTPERDTTGVAARLAEDRGQQRKSSVGQYQQQQQYTSQIGRAGSLNTNRRSRQLGTGSLDASSSNGSAGVYQ